MTSKRLALAMIVTALAAVPLAGEENCKKPTPPKAVHRVAPEYTAEARSRKYEGVVVLEAIIDAKGRVTDIELIQPAPYGLNETAIDALRQWRFEPGKCDGKPVKVIYNATLKFRLDG